MVNLVHQLQSEIGKRRKRVVVIGDAMVDVWINGHFEVCQDGCTKVVESKRTVTPGGAANAQRCLDHWGVETVLYARSKGDRPVKTRFVDSTGLIAFRHDDEVDRLDCSDYEWAREDALEMVRFAGGVLLSDYDKGFLTPEFIARVVALCNTRRIPCVADCKRTPHLYKGAILKCNHDYQHVHNDDLSELVYDNDCGESLVVTCGADIPAVWDREVLVRGLPFLPGVSCANHVGAGDCFAAHLALALGYGFSLKDAAVLAHSAGRVYVQYQHNRPPQPVEIAADLSSAVACTTVQ